MKELRDILDALEGIRRSGKCAALATIVKAKGSTYRRPGARMLMTGEGELTGSISGGCLEGDVFEHAKKVMESGEAVVVHYDTSSDDDLVWGLGLGCSGVVHVLIESLQSGDTEYLDFLEDRIKNERAGVLATVFSVEGSVAAKVGSRLAFGEYGALSGRMEEPELRAAISENAHEALQSGRSKVKEYRLSGGTAEVLIEVIQPAVSLLVFGAGHDAIPLVRLAKDLGWNVTVVDSRAAFVSKERFPQADRLILSASEEISRNVSLDQRSIVVLMTHNYTHDRNILRSLLNSQFRYLGVLGPKKRTEMLLEDLSKEGVVLAEEQLSRLYSPIGIDMGAETPEEIALAIVGEIQAVLAARSAGLLRNRKGPIHDRS